MIDSSLHWRKSSYSGTQGGNCVEVGHSRDAVLVRDTKQHGHGQTHRFTAEAWRAFVGAVKATSKASKLRRKQRASAAVW